MKKMKKVHLKPIFDLKFSEKYRIRQHVANQKRTLNIIRNEDTGTGRLFSALLNKANIYSATFIVRQMIAGYLSKLSLYLLVII